MTPGSICGRFMKKTDAKISCYCLFKRASADNQSPDIFHIHNFSSFKRKLLQVREGISVLVQFNQIRARVSSVL